MPIAPVNREIAAAFAAFFSGGSGPTRTVVDRVLMSAGLDGVSSYNKEGLILRAFSCAEREGRRRKLVEGLLSELREHRLVGHAACESGENETRLRRALAQSGWILTDDGRLTALAGVDLETGGREALDDMLVRLRSNTEDAALLIGTAKDMLEGVAKFVLEDNGEDIPTTASFDQLWRLARERLGILPEQVDQAVPGHKAIREIHQSAWAIAKQVNVLRNLQGTGHGYTLPTGVSEDLARLVVREACSIAEYTLRRLDQRLGRA